MGDSFITAGMDTIAGGAGTMWTTALQIGQLVETAHLVRYQLGFVTQLGIGGNRGMN